jgi:hypothetical protein
MGEACRGVGTGCAGGLRGVPCGHVRTHVSAATAVRTDHGVLPMPAMSIGPSNQCGMSTVEARRALGTRRRTLHWRLSTTRHGSRFHRSAANNRSCSCSGATPDRHSGGRCPPERDVPEVQRRRLFRCLHRRGPSKRRLAGAFEHPGSRGLHQPHELRRAREPGPTSASHGSASSCRRSSIASTS